MGERVICPDFHYMFVDDTKECVVIEPRGGRLEVFENPYNVMTNSPSFDSHIKRLHKTMDLNNLDKFNSSKDLPGGYDPVSRFIKAFYLTKQNVSSKDFKEALSNSYNILSAMSMPEGFVYNNQHNYHTFTRYTSSYDTSNRTLTVKTSKNPTIYDCRIEDFQGIEDKKVIYLIDEFASKKIEIR